MNPILTAAATPFKEVPYLDADTGIWSTRLFDTREHFVSFLWSCFKEPGKYEFDQSVFNINEEGRKFQARNYYTSLVPKTKDWKHYWDTQKLRSRQGVVLTHQGKTWYFTRDYYMWLNFLPIYHKEKKVFAFPAIRDVQYHIALFETIAEYTFKHVVLLKKRQIASSYFHAGKLINGFWFEEGFVGKMGASLKDYINEKGTWLFLNEYSNFLNTHTAWYRPMNPGKVFAWVQQVEVKNNGRTQTRGLKSRISGMSFEKDPTNGVGGPCTFFFHEEGGIAPQADTTYEFIRPAMQDGFITTGLFALAGSVGDLDQCKPLEKYLKNPMGNGFLGVETDLFNSKGERRVCGLFIPEQWGMPPFIDPYGNSMVKEALEAIMEQRAEWKKDLEPQEYQLRISQGPINIEEAFATRKLSKFPAHILQAEIQKIEDKTYPTEYLELYRTEQNKIQARTSRRTPIVDFPISAKTENKEGVLVVHERPVENAPWGSYYASIDPVGEGKTTTSDSLCTIYVYRVPTEVAVYRSDGSLNHTRIDGDYVVAHWCGRYDDIKDTHEMLEMIIEWYNAWALVEANVSLFINYMITQKKQKYLVPKDQIVFLKELSANQSSYQDYGWKNTGTFFKTNLLSYLIEFIKEVVNNDFDENGKVIEASKKFGVCRIRDKMALVEALAYQDGLNVDRLVALAALIAFVKLQTANRGYKKIKEYETPLVDTQKKANLLVRQPFRNLERGRSTQGIRRRPFKNL
jgi:hypothetical protein